MNLLIGGQFIFLIYWLGLFLCIIEIFAQTLILRWFNTSWWKHILRVTFSPWEICIFQSKANFDLIERRSAISCHDLIGITHLIQNLRYYSLIWGYLYRNSKILILIRVDIEIKKWLHYIDYTWTLLMFLLGFTFFIISNLIQLALLRLKKFRCSIAIDFLFVFALNESWVNNWFNFTLLISEFWFWFCVKWFRYTFDVHKDDMIRIYFCTWPIRILVWRYYFVSDLDWICY